MGEDQAVKAEEGGAKTGLTDAEKDRYVEIWKKAVETQMHFNDMSGKSRQLGLTFVAASLGVAVVMLARGDDFAISVGQWKIHVGVLLIIAGLLALRGVRDLDLNVYHRMLRGAVTFGEDFERNYLQSIFNLEKGMTGAISHFSRFDDAKVEGGASKYTYLGSRKVTAEQKIKRFYSFCTGFLAIAALALFITNNYTRLVPLLPACSFQASGSASTNPQQPTSDKPPSPSVPSNPAQAK